MLIRNSEFTIRKLTTFDTEHLFKYKGNSDCSKYLTSTIHTDQKQTALLIEKSLINYQEWNPPSSIFAIAEPDKDEVIGLLVFIFRKEYAEIHFGIIPDFSGRGIATAVCKTGINWLKSRNIIEIRTYPHNENHSSLNVLLKCGFKNHGLLKDFAIFPQLDNTLQDCIDMRITLD